jgi:hypothetical protein
VRPAIPIFHAHENDIMSGGESVEPEAKSQCRPRSQLVACDCHTDAIWRYAIKAQRPPHQVGRSVGSLGLFKGSEEAFIISYRLFDTILCRLIKLVKAYPCLLHLLRYVFDALRELLLALLEPLLNHEQRGKQHDGGSHFDKDR